MMPFGTVIFDLLIGSEVCESLYFRVRASVQPVLVGQCGPFWPFRQLNMVKLFKKE